MPENWLRWHIGTGTDPKWKGISRRSAQPIHAVIAVWTMMLECASQAANRGDLDGWDDEDIGNAIDLEADQVRAIREAMQGKTLDGDRLSGWERRQPKRERPQSDNSTPRVRKHRARQRAEAEADPTNDEAPCNATERHETPCNAKSDDVTPRNAQRREEEKREDSVSLRSTAAAGVPSIAEPAAPADGKSIAAILFGECLRYLTASGVDQKQARPMIGKWRRDYGDGEVAAAIAEAQKEAASEPIGLVTAILQQRRRAAAMRGAGDAPKISKSAIANKLFGSESNGQNHARYQSGNASLVQLAQGHRERATGNLVPEHHYLIPGPDESQRDRG
jgi:hypothetical protein